MPLCTVCDSDSFENVNGFYYCTVCSTQCQNVCDIELSDEEVGTHEIVKSASLNPKKKFKENTEKEKNLEINYTTYHVLNYLLKAQVDDLIRIGINPIIKNIVMSLWIKYLQKLEIAFLSENKKINYKNIKSRRDQKYFEEYRLQQYTLNEMDQSDELSILQNKKEMATNIIDTIDEQNKTNKEDDDDENSDNSTDDENEEDREIEDLLDEDLDEPVKENTSRNISLTKFEWIRMPHTIAILNLSLLIHKSHLLITDLIRLIYNGTISYFNIDSVLPSSLNFTYTEDTTMFNAMSIPNADNLRFLTSKLGQFLELDIGTIQLVSINEVACRFLVDLNLPTQFNSMIKLLMDKIKPRCELDFKKAENENIEAIALSYIYVVIQVLIQYKPKIINDENNFNLNEWIEEMQNPLTDLPKKVFGCDYEEVRNIDDLESINLTKIRKHRHKLDTKNYIAQYRRKEILDALKIPLNDFDNYENNENSKKNNSSNLFFYISNEEQSKSFLKKSIEEFLDEEKFKILSDKNFKSKNFKLYAKQHLQLYETKGKYLIGIEAGTNEWLLDMFYQIAQCQNYAKMFKFVDKLLNKINL